MKKVLLRMLRDVLGLCRVVLIGCGALLAAYTFVSPIFPHKLSPWLVHAGYGLWIITVLALLVWWYDEARTAVIREERRKRGPVSQDEEE